LVELIQYGLGRRPDSRANFHFAPIWGQIETEWLQILANGQSLTTERSLERLWSDVHVYQSEFSAGIRNQPSEVVSIDDLSQVLLQSLNIPEKSTRRSSGESEPLSFPTLMRAFILHQDDSFSAVLDKIPSEPRRTAIIGFLTGVYSTERFDAEVRLGEVHESPWVRWRLFGL